MFSLNEEDFPKRILGCGDGPASFNAEATAQGYHVVSVDPLYHFSAESIETRFYATRDEVIAQTEAKQDEFFWEIFRDLGHLAEARTKAFKRFIVDYPQGYRLGRYYAGELPHLPFVKDQFGLALVSHLLFLYSDQLDLQFHIDSIKELLRVADEVRIFPLMQLGSTPSPHIGGVINYFRDAYFIEMEIVDYEFQKGGNQMLRINRKQAANPSSAV